MFIVITFIINTYSSGICPGGDFFASTMSFFLKLWWLIMTTFRILTLFSIGCGVESCLRDLEKYIPQPGWLCCFFSLSWLLALLRLKSWWTIMMTMIMMMRMMIMMMMMMPTAKLLHFDRPPFLCLTSHLFGMMFLMVKKKMMTMVVVRMILMLTMIKCHPFPLF